jgi:hypothetical protein
MKRPHVMMNLISKRPSSTSAVKGGQWNKESSGNPTLHTSLLPKSADDRKKKMQNNKQKTEKQ